MAQKVRMILDGGNEFVMECEKVKVTFSQGVITNFEYSGCTKNIPLFIDLAKVTAVVQEEIT